MAETLGDDTTSTAILSHPSWGLRKTWCGVPRMGLMIMRVERASWRRIQRLTLMSKVLEGIGRISIERLNEMKRKQEGQ